MSSIKKPIRLPPRKTSAVQPAIETPKGESLKGEKPPVEVSAAETLADKKGLITENTEILNRIVLPPPFKIEKQQLTELNKDYPGDIQISESGKLLKRFIVLEGFRTDCINIYNHWINEVLPQTITSQELKLSDESVIKFGNVRCLKPTYTANGKKLDLTPQYAREKGKSYLFEVQVTVYHYNIKNQLIKEYNDIIIGEIPAMIKSNVCHLENLDEMELIKIGEDPKDPGGYYIIEDIEKIVLNKEILCLNKFFITKVSSKTSKQQKNVIKAVINMTNEIKSGGTSHPDITLGNKNKVVKYKFPSIQYTSNNNRKVLQVNILKIFSYFGYDGTKLIASFIQKEHREKSMNELIASQVLNVGTDREYFLNKIKKKIDNDNKRNDEIHKKLQDTKKTALKGLNTIKLLSKEDEDNAINNIFVTDLFPHLNFLSPEDGESVQEYQKRIIDNKMNMLAIMTARYLEYLAGYIPLDDRDSWSNKRVDVSGKMIALLFRSTWKRKLAIIGKKIEGKSVDDIIKELKSTSNDSFITKTIHDSFKTNNWGVKGLRGMKTAMTAPLNRESAIATYSHLNTIDVKMDRSGNSTTVRDVQFSQAGFIDPSHIPEGKNCGLVKNLAITTVISPDISRDLVNSYVSIIKKENIISNKETTDMNTKLVIEAIFIGWCNGRKMKQYLLDKRRSLRFSRYMSIIDENDFIYVDFSVCRLLRPLLIVNVETQKLVIDEKKLIGAPNEKLFEEGAIEYVSPWEQESIQLALSKTDIEFRTKQFEAYNSLDNTVSESERRKHYNAIKKKLPYTHCEIDPKSTLGIAANLVPWGNHNQAPRTTFAIAMIKQVVGIYHTNHINRFDGRTRTLCFPTRSMVETEMTDVLGLDVKGSGQMATIAIMAYEQTEEDALIINKRFVDLGGFRTYRYMTFRTTVEKTSEYEEKLTKPLLTSDETRNNPNIYKYIGENGLPYIGAPLKEGACVIGKIITNLKTKETKNDSTLIKIGDQGIVDRILVNQEGNKLIVKVKVRLMRVPQPGDKFAPRNAQKTTCGRIESDEDMPFTAGGLPMIDSVTGKPKIDPITKRPMLSKGGLTPSLIVNPHCIPGRMTISYFLEILASAGGALLGKRVNGSMFSKFNEQDFKKVLKEYGYNEYSREKMISGRTGKEIDAQIFMGPVFFQVLKHQVEDKIQARERGRIDPITRQPTKGKSKRGGLRFGEMERDTAISHGASSFLNERLCLVSDPYTTVFCKCGHFAQRKLSSSNAQVYTCNMCGNDKNFGKITIPYTYKVLIHYMAAMGINLKPQLYEEKQINKATFDDDEDIEAQDIEDIENEDIENEKKNKLKRRVKNPEDSDYEISDEEIDENSQSSVSEDEIDNESVGENDYEDDYDEDED
jgi:DNA-directed RNA polymerase beta subunit